MNVFVGCEDVDDSALPTTSDGNVSNRAANITTAKTTWNIKSIVADTEYPIDITTAVQEVINRVGWVSGNDIAVLIVNSTCPTNEWQQVFSVDGSGAKAPIIDIDYTDPTTGNGQPAHVRHSDRAA